MMALVVTTSSRKERTEIGFLIDGELPRRNIVLVRVNQGAAYGWGAGRVTICCGSSIKNGGLINYTQEGRPLNGRSLDSTECHVYAHISCFFVTALMPVISRLFNTMSHIFYFIFHNPLLPVTLNDCFMCALKI